MAVAPDNANSVQGTGVANLTTSAWAIAGSDRVLVAGMVWSASVPPNYSAMKWDGSAGTALTQKGATLAIGANLKIALASLIAPVTGSKTLYGELSGTTDEFCVGGASVTGAHQTSPLGTAITSSATTAASPATATANTVVSASGELVIDIAGATHGTADTLTVAVGAGQTLRWEQESIGTFSAGTQSTEPGAATVNMTEVFTAGGGTIDWGIIAVSIAAAPSGAQAPLTASKPLLVTLQRDTSRFSAVPIPSYLRDSIPAAIIPAIPGNTQQPILAAFERRFGRMPMGRIPPALPPLVTASAWSSQGDSSASWTGASTAASAWSSSGDATATWIGASLAASVWNASGDGTATWVGSSKAASIWSASGDSTATWVGAARGSGVWSASGDAAAAWTGASTAVSVWSSSGDSSAAWTGGSLAAGVWSASGDSSAAWVGTSGGNVWSASGDSVAQWVGAADALSIWSASGDSLALFVGTSLFDGANELGAKPLGHGLRKRKLRHVPAKLKDQHPDDIERERRMLEEYIATLKPQRARRGKGAPVAVTPAAQVPAVAPRLSEAMASLATMQELARISRANQVAEEDRRKAEKERQRRRAVAVLLMMTF